MRRSSRRGLWENLVLPIFGRYPWRCNFCRNRQYIEDRGPYRSYVESDRSARRTRRAPDSP